MKEQQKLDFFENILKIDRTKRENAFEKLNHISFVTWAVTQNTNFWVLLLFWPVKKLNNNIFDVDFFSQIGRKIRIICLEIEGLLNTSKKCNDIFPFWIDQKSALFQRKSALETAQILSSENFRSSALFRDFQVKNSAESELKYF